MKSRFKKNHSHLTKRSLRVLEFLLSSMFFVLDSRDFRRTLCVLIYSNCNSLLVDLFLCSYEAHIMQVSREKEEIKMLAGSFNFMFCYIDDVLSLNNPTFGDYGDLILQELKQIYRICGRFCFLWHSYYNFIYNWLLLTGVAAGDFRRGHSPVPSSFVAYHLVGGRSDTTVTPWGLLTLLPQKTSPSVFGGCVFFFHLWFSVGFCIDHCVVLFLFFWQLYCLFQNYGFWLPFKHTGFIKIFGFNRNPSRKRSSWRCHNQMMKEVNTSWLYAYNSFVGYYWFYPLDATIWLK